MGAPNTKFNVSNMVTPEPGAYIIMKRIHYFSSVFGPNDAFDSIRPLMLLMPHPTSQAHHSSAQTPEAVNIALHVLFMCFSFFFGQKDAMID